jgi:hypothetical protein
VGAMVQFHVFLMEALNGASQLIAQARLSQKKSSWHLLEMQQGPKVDLVVLVHTKNPAMYSFILYSSH